MSEGPTPCASCGHPNTGDAMFCSKCGAKLGGAASAPPTDRPPAPTVSDAREPVPSTGRVGADTVESEAVPLSEPPPSEPPPSEPPPPEPPASEPPPPEPPPSEPPPPEPPPPSQASRGAPRRIAGAAQTMLGMPMPEVEAARAAAAKAAAKTATGSTTTSTERPAAESPFAERPSAQSGQAEGSAAPAGASAGAAPTGAPDGDDTGARAAKLSGGRTMLGMPAPEAEAVARAVAEARARQADAAPTPRDEKVTEEVFVPPVVAQVASAAAKPGFTQPQSGPAQSSQPQSGPEQSSQPQPASRRPAIDPKSNRTMLGQPAPKRPTGIESSDSQRARSSVVYPANTGEEEALTAKPSRPPSKLPYVVLALGLVITLIGGGALAWALMDGGSGLHVSVTHGEEGEQLEIEVPGAEPGTRVRFHGEERALEAGIARFELSADDLRLGDNELAVDVVGPDGDVDSHTVSLALEMRIRADVGALSAVPPAIDVIVEAPPGSQVQLDGEALELDERGRGQRRYPIDGTEASAEGMVEHLVRYVVHPPEGETAQGELRTRIPLTTLQLDRPGAQVVTDQASVEVAGAVAPGTTVTVGGADVAVQMGRFVHTHAIEGLGESTLEVIARAPGRAPNVSRIAIRRVEDLEAEAASFAHNAELTYARIAQNPTTYRGQRVRFEGLVYNVEVSRGRSVLQILAEDCPAGERCPLWITYPAATDAENRSRVVVLGTVAGEQQFRSQSGQIRTVPRVDATFVLPAPAGASNRRR